MNTKFISIDFQKDFCDPNGLEYIDGDCIAFVHDVLIPFFRGNKIIVNEIISDYRDPRPHNDDSYKNNGKFCIPGTIGYESVIPADIVNPERWIKCMHGPLWTRENIGNANLPAGRPYQDPLAFGKWLEKSIGPIEENFQTNIVLFGLAMDDCLRCLAQELHDRGYKNIKALYEATDIGVAPRDQDLKRATVLTMRQFCEPIRFTTLQKDLEKEIY